ncbi:unnamed protein product [Linum tenue]|uniref:Subtilisin-like protease fibronectin type-III domain-containing protein n=1 Tax=Linum tenue TaxID=586396 RepID=A0AAV0M8C3_9ROSI|nr:unnamed protein product [Linum tenue]
MTTADALDLSDEPIKDFGTLGKTAATGLDMGAGQVNPNKAVDPGLVYDLHASDYVNLLCAMNFTKNQIKAFTRSSSAAADCSNPSLDLNYPSFIASFAKKKNYSTSCQPSDLQVAEFHRTLTNVGEATACYRAVVTPLKRFVTRVVPEKLEFKHKGEKLGYKLVLERVEESSSSPAEEEEEFVASGYLKWVEVGGTHVVQSPIVATINN